MLFRMSTEFIVLTTSDLTRELSRLKAVERGTGALCCVVLKQRAAISENNKVFR